MPIRFIALLLLVLIIATTAAAVVVEGESCDAYNTDGSCVAFADEPGAASVPDTGRRGRTKCEDKETACKSWAAAGECDANPDYMLRE